LASSLSVGLYTGFLSLWWRHRFGKETFFGLGKDFLKVLVLSLLAFFPAMGVMKVRLIDANLHPYWEAIYAISFSGVCFSVIFIGLARYFVPDLIQPILQKAGPLGRLLLR